MENVSGNRTVEMSVSLIYHIGKELYRGEF